MDGHDKLNSAGFGIYGIRDKFSGNHLHYKVLPSNRYASVVGVVFLQCAKKRGGLCIILGYNICTEDAGRSSGTGLQ